MSRVFWDTNLFIYLFEDYGVLSKAVARFLQGKGSYGDPDSKKLEGYAEPGKQRWCRRRWRVQ